MQKISLIKTQIIHDKKIIVLGILVILIFNIVFIAISQPAKAAYPVYDAPLNGLQSAWKAVDTGFQKTQAIASSASTAIDGWFKSHQIVEDLAQAAALSLLTQILNILTNDIIGWIQNGETPRFISGGMEAFLGNAADRALGNFVDNYLHADILCRPLVPHIRLALLTKGKFEDRAKCDLSDMGDNIGGFMENFSNGDWTEWIRLNQPRNNFYGLYLMTQDAMNQEAAQAKEEADKEAQLGQGILEYKECVWNDKNNNEVAKQRDIVGYPPPAPDVCGLNGTAAKPCTYKCRTLTPNTIIRETLNTTIKEPMEEIQDTISNLTANLGIFGTYTQAILNAAFNRIMKEGLAGIQAIYGPDGKRTTQSDIDRAILQLPQSGSTMPLTLSQVKETESFAKDLNNQLNIYQNNLQNELLLQQNNNLSVLNQIRQNQVAILDALVEMSKINKCNLPSWATTKDLTPSCDINNPTCCQTKEITAINIGVATTQIGQGCGAAQTTYNPSIDQKITQLNQGISTTNNLISKTSTAIQLNNNYQNSLQNYSTVYEETKGDLANEKLINTRKDLQEAHDALIRIIGELTGNHTSTIQGAITDVQGAAGNAIIEANDLYIERGDASYPETGTLYKDLENSKNSLDDIQQKLRSC